MEVEQTTQLCSFCNKPCVAGLSQSEDYELWEFKGKQAHIECFIKWLAREEVKKLIREAKEVSDGTTSKPESSGC